jgi:hypothetical protein
MIILQFRVGSQQFRVSLTPDSELITSDSYHHLLQKPYYYGFLRFSIELPSATKNTKLWLLMFLLQSIPA